MRNIKVHKNRKDFDNDSRPTRELKRHHIVVFQIVHEAKLYILFI